MTKGLLGLASLSLLLFSSTAHAAPTDDARIDLGSAAPLFILGGLALAGGSLCRRES